MGKYVDGFVLPVPKKKLAAYRRMSQAMGKLMKKYGALEYVEAVGDDLNPKMGGSIKFAKMVNAKSNETVFFSYIVFKSRAHRDKVNKIVMEEMMRDPKNKESEVPFDMARIAYGGFKVIVDA